MRLVRRASLALSGQLSEAGVAALPPAPVMQSQAGLASPASPVLAAAPAPPVPLPQLGGLASPPRALARGSSAFAVQVAPVSPVPTRIMVASAAPTPSAGGSRRIAGERGPSPAVIDALAANAAAALQAAAAAGLAASHRVMIPGSGASSVGPGSSLLGGARPSAGGGRARSIAAASGVSIQVRPLQAGGVAGASGAGAAAPRRLLPAAAPGVSGGAGGAAAPVAAVFSNPLSRQPGGR